MNIRYDQKNGKIVFCDDGSMPCIQGVVPSKIQNQGTEAIRAYVEKRINRELKRRKQARDIEANRMRKYHKTDILITISYNGTTLRGAVIEIDKWNMRMRMDEPFQITETWCYSTGVATEKSHFDQHGQINDIGIVAQAIGLVQQLNAKKS